MSRHYKIRNQSNLNFLSFATVNWIDVFIRSVYKDIVVESLNYCVVHKGLEVYAWCIMSSHVHLIIGTQEKPTEDIIRDLKRHTAKAILKAISENGQESRRNWMLYLFRAAGEKNSKNAKYQFWRQDNHPLVLKSNQFKEEKLYYLHQNPLTAGLVAEPQYYIYSSALDYAGGKGLILITYL